MRILRRIGVGSAARILISLSRHPRDRCGCPRICRARSGDRTAPGRRGDRLHAARRRVRRIRGVRVGHVRHGGIGPGVAVHNGRLLAGLIVLAAHRCHRQRGADGRGSNTSRQRCRVCRARLNHLLSPLAPRRTGRRIVPLFIGTLFRKKVVNGSAIVPVALRDVSPRSTRTGARIEGRCWRVQFPYESLPRMVEAFPSRQARSR